MIALGLQLVFASIAAFRGWGFRPFGYLIGLVIFALLVGVLFGVNTFSVGLLLTLDWALVGFLGYMAISGKEKE